MVEEVVVIDVLKVEVLMESGSFCYVLNRSPLLSLSQCVRNVEQRVFVFFH